MDMIETKNVEVQEVASTSVPEDMEGAVFDSPEPEPDALPAAVLYVGAAGAAYAAGTNVADAATEAALGTVSDFSENPFESDISKHSSVDELLEVHEQNRN
jgi:hypothetical protein